MTTTNYEREAWPSLDDALLLTEWIGGGQAHRLAVLADCVCPDSPDSPGGRYLLKVAESVLEQIRDKNREDRIPDGLIHEIVENGVPTYTADIWATFADLGGYEVELDGDLIEPDDITQSLGARALYVIAETLAAGLFDSETYYSRRAGPLRHRGEAARE